MEYFPVKFKLGYKYQYLIWCSGQLDQLFVLAGILVLIVAFSLLNSCTVFSSKADLCKKEGGQYSKTSFSGYSCIKPLSDGGKKCINSKECQGVCEAIYLNEEKHWEKFGTCSASTVPSYYSCKDQFENGKIESVACE